MLCAATLPLCIIALLAGMRTAASAGHATEADAHPPHALEPSSTVGNATRAPPPSAEELNAKFNDGGVLVRLFWDSPFTNFSSFCKGEFEIPQTLSELGKATNGELFRSTSFLRHDLPVAVANDFHYCPSGLEIGVIINPATVGRGCAFFTDANTGTDHLQRAVGKDWEPGFQLCDTPGCEQCCNAEWEDAATQIKTCNIRDHNEFLARYRRSDILGIFYLGYTPAGPHARSAELYQRCLQLKRFADIDVDIFELNLPVPRPRKGKDNQDEWGSSAMPFDSTRTRIPPFSMPPLSHVTGNR